MYLLWCAANSRSLRAVQDAACSGMAVITPDPRVNFSLLERFIGHRVCLVGRVSTLQLSTQQLNRLCVLVCTNTQ